MSEPKQLEGLILQSLEHEHSGMLIYEAALNCAKSQELRERWQKHTSESQSRVDVLERLCAKLGIDPDAAIPGREVVRHIGDALVSAMELAASKGDWMSAELVACECVVLMETKQHLNWSLLGTCAVALGDFEKAALRAAYREVSHAEDEHLQHSKGWCRELWLRSLGLNAVLPPPEQLRRVTSTLGAAKVAATAHAVRSQRHQERIFEYESPFLPQRGESERAPATEQLMIGVCEQQ